MDKSTPLSVFVSHIDDIKITYLRNKLQQAGIFCLDDIERVGHLFEENEKLKMANAKLESDLKALEKKFESKVTDIIMGNSPKRAKINEKKVDFIHFGQASLLDAVWNPTAMEQNIGRAVRYLSPINDGIDDSILTKNESTKESSGLGFGFGFGSD